MEPTSEQELKELLEEGKITEQEYHELLEAIRQKETSKLITTESSQLKSQINYRKIVPLVFIICGVLPLLVALVVHLLLGIHMLEVLCVIMVAIVPVILCILLIIGVVASQRKR